MSETIMDSKAIATQYIDMNRNTIIDELSKRIDVWIEKWLQEIKDGKYSTLEEVNESIQKEFFT